MQKETVLLLLTPKEVSKQFLIPLHKIYNLLIDGHLIGFKVGSDWRIRRDSVEKYLGPLSNEFLTK